MSNRLISSARFPALQGQPAVALCIIDNGDGTCSLFVVDGEAIYPTTSAAIATLAASGQAVVAGAAVSGLFNYINSGANILTGAVKSFTDRLNSKNGFSMGDLSAFALPNKYINFWFDNGAGGNSIVFQVVDTGGPGNAFSYASVIGLLGANSNGFYAPNDGNAGGFGIFSIPNKDGYAKLLNKSFNAFTALVFGPDLTTAWAMLKVVSSPGAGKLQVRFADDSDFADFEVSNLFADADVIANGLVQGGTLQAAHLDSKRVVVTVDGPTGAGTLDALALTDGQILIGKTGDAPLAANITSADGSVVITNGANSIDLSVTGGSSSVIPEAATPVNLTNADSNKIFTNEGAAALGVFNLPTAVAGLRYTFIVQDADGIQVVANAGDTIRIGSLVSAAAGNASATDIGSVLELIAINATEWIAISVIAPGAGWTVV